MHSNAWPLYACMAFGAPTTTMQVTDVVLWTASVSLDHDQVGYSTLQASILINRDPWLSNLES